MDYLETIGACARQHFVDAEHVEGVHADPDVELVLGRVLHHVLQKKGIHIRSCFQWFRPKKSPVVFSKKLECIVLQSWSAHTRFIIMNRERL